MIVVLNKVDLLPLEKRASSIEKVTKRMLKTLENTRFSGSPIVAVAANPGAAENPDLSNCVGVADLIGQ
ncbi:EEFSEC [Bugula neritina]|uniref:EEFSEC n=1 Tax=Bugula neritina TaxID=10212 RepID=A0A7J7JQC7_BUGNE|nr:EEFSEC [Bugula neritina]